MNQGQGNGHGDDESHSVGSAASVIEGLLSDDESEDQQTDDTASNAPEEQETAEDTGEDEQQPESEDESAEAEEEQSVATPEPKKHKVKVDGQELEVTEDELLKGYSRNADYTRKTQALAEQAKAFEAEQQQVRAERQRYATQLVELEGAIKGMTQEPDWDKLRTENPEAFPEVFASWQLHQKRISDIESERQQAVSAVQADMAQQQRAVLHAEQQKLLEAIPAWKDAEVSKSERAALLAYGQDAGFNEQELHSVVDHRALVLLRKAMLFDKAEKDKAAAAAKGQEKIERARVVPPGSSAAAKPKVNEGTRRFQRLKKTGSERDAASLIELMLED
jgi:hypothetical protein